MININQSLEDHINHFSAIKMKLFEYYQRFKAGEDMRYLDSFEKRFLFSKNGRLLSHIVKHA